MSKILIIKMSALGDILMALPHVEAITQYHTDDQITLLTGPGFGTLFTDHPRLHMEILDRQDLLGKLGTIGRALWVRNQKFDTIYDLQGNRTSRNVVRFSGASKRVGTQPRKIYNFHPETAYTKSTQQNASERIADTLIAAGLPIVKTQFVLYFSDDDRDAVEQFKDQHNLDSTQYILFHAGSSSEWPSKQWPKDNFIELAAMLSHHSIVPVWVGGAEDIMINQYLSNSIGVDATGMFSLRQLALMAGGALCAVTNDSGPMHLLATANIPVYSFFGPTSWIRSHAIGQKRRVLISEAPCSPCFKGTCPAERKNHCLADIPVERIYEKIHDELLRAD